MRVSARIRVPRYAGMPIEPRGVLAEPSARGNGLTVWASTQVPHWLQRTLCETLDLPAHRMRVIAPDVGGGFGTKASIYPEDVLIPVIAARLGRPVKWIETRESTSRARPTRGSSCTTRSSAPTRDGTDRRVPGPVPARPGRVQSRGASSSRTTRSATSSGPYRIRERGVRRRGRS